MNHRTRPYRIADYPIRAIFFAVVVLLHAAEIVGADAERELLLEKSAELRDALIIADFEDSSNDGCFIGEDGLAVFSILTFSGPKAPEQFLLIDKTPLKPPILRYVSAEHGIALVDFDYRPTVVIEPSSAAVSLNLRVAILDRMSANPVVAIGPVKSRGKYAAGSHIRPNYRPCFSIAAGLPAGREWPPAPGAPVIDSTGKLRGTFNSTRHLGSQTLLHATDASLWFAEVAEARASEQSIEYPLPPKLNPMDPASSHPEYLRAVAAVQQREYEAAIEHVQTALKDHPDSPLLHYLHFDIARTGAGGDLLALAAAIKPPQGGTLAEQVTYLLNLAWACSETGDQEGAEATYLKAVELAPKEAWLIRYNYANWLWKRGDPNRALTYLRQAADAAPESIQVLGDLGKLLGQLNKWAEADEVSDRILELEELYQPTTSATLHRQNK